MYGFKIFYEKEFTQVTGELLHNLESKVNQEDQTYILNVNETEYLEFLVSSFEIEALELHFEQLKVAPIERQIPAERFPGPQFYVEAGQSYQKQVIQYYVPFSGNRDLLKYTPSPRVMRYATVLISDNAVRFEVINFYDDPEQIKREADSILSFLKQQASYLAVNVQEFNAHLPERAKALFEKRRAEIMRQNKLVESLGVPIKKAAHLPQTFVVPAAVRKKTVTQPEASTERYSPEPTLDQTVYEEILQVIHDTGRVFERLPSTYAGKDEETLRDHLILQLEPRFEGSTTGETFNKAGKTDILIRHEKRNVFVAECKFWGGAKRHLEAIDQILSYLTWRDSKTALVYFVDTKEMTAPLRSIEESTIIHPCFVSARGKREESWFKYEFHLPGDTGRSLQLAILCFHFPKSK